MTHLNSKKSLFRLFCIMASSGWPLDHVRVDILKLFSEVKITFDVRGQVSNIETPSNLMDVNWPPEGKANRFFRDQVTVFQDECRFFGSKDR